ncbi:MAG: hypothetical protein HKN76_15860 [Saprospiraceae bacterium]|nr:hypothetical protein [Saprospiraceae bacterium]
MGKNDLSLLKELAEVVTKNKVKSVDILSNKDANGRTFDFYERILNDSFKSDQEAAEFYFDKESQYPQYRKLKNKLKEKLINTAFFVDVNSPKFNTHQKAFYTCQKNLMAVRILIGRYARKPAIQLALDTLKKSIKYELPEISLELCRLLRSHYATQSKNESAYRKYSNLASFYQKNAAAEDLAISRYEHTSILMRKSTRNQIVIELCDNYCEELKPFTKEFTSFRLNLWYYFIAIRGASLKKDHKKVIALCNEAISFLSSKGFVSSHFIGALYYQKLTSLIQKKDFVTARDVSQKCVSIFEENTIRWYSAHGFSFQFAMHSGQFRKALNIREKVVNSEAFHKQFQNREESWRLNDAYLYYLYLRGKLNIPKSSGITSFRIKKFLNEVPTFSMDKSGYNIPILIIQILIQIHHKKYDQLTDKIEAIEKYTSRYLRKENNYRSNCFIKMLLQMPKQHFHRVAVERHTKTLLAKLKSMPLAKANQPFEIEIIPYENLWLMARESLG